jgi:DNA-binding winged helix-turn-helix (wHTH) protein
LFGEYALHAGRRKLTRRGAPIDIEPQVFDLLLALIENHERVVTLLGEPAWPRFLDEVGTFLRPPASPAPRGG